MKLPLILGAMALAVVLAIATHPGPVALAVAGLALGVALLRTGRRAVAALAVMLIVALFAPAWAGEAAGVPSADPGILASIVMPLALSFGALFVPIIGSRVWARVSKALDKFETLTGVQIDAEHRQALHSAIDTGLKLAFARGVPAMTETLDGHLAAGRLDEVAKWVRRSVPGAVAHLGVTRDLLDGLTTARLSDSLAAAAAPALALPGAILGGLTGAATPAEAPRCAVCGTSDPNAVCTRADCPDAAPAAAAVG